MSEYPVHLIAIDDIAITKNRQRRGLGDLRGLALSIARNGLLQPIIVTNLDKKWRKPGEVYLHNEDYILIAGERRLTCFKFWFEATGYYDEIPCLFLEDLPGKMLKLIELEENIKRQALEWKDEVLACLLLHDIYTNGDDEWGVDQTAEILSLSPRSVSRYLSVARALKAGNNLITPGSSIDW